MENKERKYHKVGINSLANRLYYINDQIPLDWLNVSIDRYKVKCKELYLKM